MEKEFVNYELSLRMKALGFDEPCFSYYELDGRLSDTPKESGDDIKYQGDCKFDNHQNTYLDEDESCSAPTWHQAFRWFESKGYRNYVASNQFGGEVNYWFAITPPEELTYSDVEGRSTKEAAELACLDKLIEIVEQKQ
jgi:hypothetical protein